MLSLHTLLIDNIIRLGSRNKNGNISFNQRHQMITHKNHSLSNLVIKHIDELNFHCGNEQTLAILMNKYWIPNISGLIRKPTMDCLNFWKVSATPNPPFITDVPKGRLQHNHKPFTNTAIDFFGLFYIKLSKATRSSVAKGKRYLVIFQCRTTCTVHLEISNSSSTDFFILSLKWSIERRGQVKRLVSDNGTNLIGTEP